MRVMGVDPGLARTGYGIVEQRGSSLVAVAYGTVRAAPGPVAAQLLGIRSALAAASAEHRPDAVAVERLFVNHNRRTAIRVGQASGVALLVAAEAGLEVLEYTPSEVKRAVTGVGTASKDQVLYMVRAILGLRDRPDSADATDALALGICHLHGARLRRAAAGAGGAR